MEVADILLSRANELVETVPGMEIIGTAANKVLVMSSKIAGLHPSDIGTLLDQQGIAIRTGHHCAMPLMDFYGQPVRQGFVRSTIRWKRSRNCLPACKDPAPEEVET